MKKLTNTYEARIPTDADSQKNDIENDFVKGDTTMLCKKSCEMRKPYHDILLGFHKEI